MFASEIRKRRVQGMRSSHWRDLDKMFVKVNGEMHYLWRAVDHEGEVLESFVTKSRDKKAALKFLRKAMRKHVRCERYLIDKLRSYGAAMKELGVEDRRDTGLAPYEYICKIWISEPDPIILDPIHQMPELNSKADLKILQAAPAVRTT